MVAKLRMRLVIWYLKLVIGLMLVLLQVYSISLGVGEEGLPWISFVATVLYGLLCRSHILAFLVGFLSVMAFPAGVFWFYYVRGRIELPDPYGWLALTIYGCLFGLVGVVFARLSEILKARSSSSIIQR